MDKIEKTRLEKRITDYQDNLASVQARVIVIKKTISKLKRLLKHNA